MSNRHGHNVSPLDQLDAVNFAPSSFVDLISWQAQSSYVPDSRDGGVPSFDAEALLDRFERVVVDVKEYVHHKGSEIHKLESTCEEVEEKFNVVTTNAQRRNVEALDKARELEQKIDEIAKKIGAFSDAVEVINRPRNNLQMSLAMLRIFDRFYTQPRGLEEDVSKMIPQTLPELLKYAETTLALASVAENLPDASFKEAKERIQRHYELVQQRLMDQFEQFSHDGSTAQLKQVSTVLSRFKTFPKAVDNFIDNFVKNNVLFDRSRFSSSVVSVTLKAHQAINDTFLHAQEVFSKYLQQLFAEQIQPFVSEKIGSARSLSTSLDALYQAYLESDKIKNELSGKFPQHQESIHTMHARMFEKHSEKYLRAEEQHLNEECENVLRQMYNSFSHQKVPNLDKTVDSTSSTMGRLLGPSAEVLPPPGKTLVTQQAALDILQRHRKAKDRSRILTTASNRQEALVKIFDSLLRWTIDEQLNYAVLVGLLRLQLSEGGLSASRDQPDGTFFYIVCEVNEIFQLIEKEMGESYVVLLTSPTIRDNCIAKRLEKVARLEEKMNVGLDKQMNLVINHVRNILTNEQKKTDFRTDQLPQGSAKGGAQGKSEACEKVTILYLKITKRRSFLKNFF